MHCLLREDLKEGGLSVPPKPDPPRGLCWPVTCICFNRSLVPTKTRKGYTSRFLLEWGLGDLPPRALYTGFWWRATNPTQPPLLLFPP